MTSTKALMAVLVAPLLAQALSSSTAAQTAPLIFAGAGSNLAITRILVEAFVKDHPGVVVEIPESIGSTGGIKAVAEGAVTLGLTARPLREGEKGLNLSQVPYARTIIVIGAHPAVNDTTLTYEELVRIYQGRKTRWRDGKEIIVLSRDEGESTIDVMNQVIPGFKEAHVESLKVRRWIVAFTDQEMNKRLESTPQAIGMTDRGSIIAERLHIKSLALNSVDPTPENAQRGLYPLVKTMAFVFRSDRIPETARAFIAFVQSPSGRKILAENGYLAGE